MPGPIELLYRAAVEPELWPQALQQFALSGGGIGTAMIPITPGDTTGLIVSPDLAESKPEYDREWWRHDPHVQRIFSRKLKDGVCCEAELFSDEEIARDPMRQEFCRKYGMGSFAAQLVTPMPNFVVAFSVMRALHLGQFEKHELEKLSLLGKHAARALVISTRLAAAQSHERIAVAAFGQLDCAAVVVDRELNVLYANAAVERLAGDGLSVRKKKLQTSSRLHQDALTRFIASVMQSRAEADPTPFVLPRPSGKQPLLVQAVPIVAAPDGKDIPTHAAALVIIVDPSQQGHYDLSRELRLLGLTQAEARLGALIGAGQSRREAAEALNISESTASDTLKQVYFKLGISRQSELVRLVIRLAVLQARRHGDGLSSLG